MLEIIAIGFFLAFPLYQHNIIRKNPIPNAPKTPPEKSEFSPEMRGVFDRILSSEYIFSQAVASYAFEMIKGLSPDKTRDKGEMPSAPEMLGATSFFVIFLETIKIRRKNITC